MLRKHLQAFQVTTRRHCRKCQDPLITGIAKAKRKLGEGEDIRGKQRRNEEEENGTGRRELEGVVVW